MDISTPKFLVLETFGGQMAEFLFRSLLMYSSENINQPKADVFLNRDINMDPDDVILFEDTDWALLHLSIKTFMQQKLLR